MRSASAFALLAASALVLSTGASARTSIPTKPQFVAVNSATFNDPQGDATSGGLDITTVTLSNDDAGSLTFSIRVPSHPTLPGGKYIGIFFDTDRNASTGAGGAEYRVFTEDPQQIKFARWDSAPPGGWVLVDNVLQSASYSNGLFAGRLSTSGLGAGVTTFNVSVLTFQDVGSSRSATDLAPNSGVWTYEIRLGQQPPPANRVAFSTVTRSPAPPVAGQTFEIVASVVRVGRPGAFNGTLVCIGTIGGRRIPAKGSFPGGGQVACEWDVPASAGGKTMVVIVSVSENGPTASHRYAARVLAPRKPRLVAGGSKTDPPRGPTAGKGFYIALTVYVRRPAGEQRIQSGVVTCRARIGSRPLEVIDRRVLKKEGVICGWQIPYGTTGSAMNAEIVVRSPGTTPLNYRFTRRVR